MDARPGRVAGSEAADGRPRVSRCLVVYYSRTGRTAKAAEAIAAVLVADLEPIHDVTPRVGGFGYLKSAIMALRERPSAILPPLRDPADYELVVLGCPVWAGKMATPMRAYIERNRAGIHRLALFCTLGGSGGEATLSMMEQRCGLNAAATLQLDDTDFASSTWRVGAEAFAYQILGKLRPARSASAV